MQPKFFSFVAKALVVSLLAGFTYVASQQVLRQSANDPQIQIAEDLAAALANGQLPSSLKPAGADVDAAHSLAPFFVIYDESGKVLLTTGKINGADPKPPQGVFDYTKANGENRVTWQPQPDMRFASVIIHYEGKNPGFVLAARSLRETEKRAGDLMHKFFLIWLAAIGTLLIGCQLAWRKGEKA